VREEFDIPLNSGDMIRVRMVREGKTVVDYLAQFETLIDGEYYPVIRYDSRHGHPHRDTLDWTGETIDKRWAPAVTTYNRALTDALDDIEANQERYREQFLRRRP